MYFNAWWHHRTLLFEIENGDAVNGEPYQYKKMWLKLDDISFQGLSFQQDVAQPHFADATM